MYPSFTGFPNDRRRMLRGLRRRPGRGQDDRLFRNTLSVTTHHHMDRRSRLLKPHRKQDNPMPQEHGMNQHGSNQGLHQRAAR